LPTPEDVNARYSRCLSKATKEFLSTLLDTPAKDVPSFHFFRTIYAMVSYEARKPRGMGVYRGPTLHAHIQQVLGHDSQDVSRHYNRLVVDGDPIMRIDYTGDE
jgi:hypothetical protein